MKRVLQVVSAVAAVSVGAACGETKVQPIPFNHKLHIEKAELQCDSCHENVAEGTVAGFPRVKVCLRCHKNEDPANAAAMPHVELIRRHGAEGTDIPWQRLYRLPSHVYFSHRRHTELGELECKECHGDMAALTAPPTEPIASTLTMSNCMACHERRGVENDCSWCHR